MKRSASLLLLALLPLLIACSHPSLKNPLTSPQATYSSAFGFWLFRSDLLSAEMDDLQEQLAKPGDDTFLRNQLQWAVDRQRDYDQALRQLQPPPDWQAKHDQIVEVLDGFDAAAGQFQPNASPQPVATLASQLEDARVALLNRVVRCYAQSPGCEGP